MKTTRLTADPDKTLAWLRKSKLAAAMRKVLRKPLNKRGRRHAATRERDFGKKADWVRTLPCDTCGAAAPSEPSHYPSRGAGGTSRHLFPQCALCHADMHQYGIVSFLGWKLKSRAWLTERTAHWEREWRQAA